SASARFRHAVRAAYRSTCVVCGQHLPSTRMNIPGVDAAHILPWAEYDLDEISNGLCLCKHHHWAFDEGLILIRFRDGRYFVEIPDEVTDAIKADAEAFSLGELQAFAGQIPEVRLPQRPEHRPRPRFLEMLAAVE